MKIPLKKEKEAHTRKSILQMHQKENLNFTLKIQIGKNE